MKLKRDSTDGVVLTEVSWLALQRVKVRLSHSTYRHSYSRQRLNVEFSLFQTSSAASLRCLSQKDGSHKADLPGGAQLHPLPTPHPPIHIPLFHFLKRCTAFPLYDHSLLNFTVPKSPQAKGS